MRDDSGDEPARAGRRRRLGIGYRIGWCLNYALLNAYGPADLGGPGQPDPRVAMRAERALRTSRLQPALPGSRRGGTND